MTETPKVGDRVRYSYHYEGVVTKVENEWVHIGEESCHRIEPQPKGWRTQTLEILERAKPVWQNGDVALEADCTIPVIWCADQGRFNWPSGVKNMGNWDTFKLILRNGKPV